MTEDDHRDLELERLLRTVDHDPPPVTAATVIDRAQSTARPPGRARWAAGIVLALGAAGLAYALPGSPLRDWVEGTATRSERIDAPDPSAPTLQPGEAGVGLDPRSPQVISFPTPRGGRVRVVLTDGPLIVLEGTPDAARFTSEPGRLLVEASAPADFQLRIPGSAARVELVVAGERVFLKEGPRVTADVSPGPDGAYLLSLGSAPH